VCVENTENEKEKKGGRHKPPSRIKYEKNNPNWTVRMPLLWHKDYEIYVKRLGLCRRDFMGVSLEKIKLNYEQARNQGYKDGYANGYKKGRDEGYAEGESVGYQNGHEKGFSEGEQVGYDQGASDCSIWCYCCICGEPIYVKPDSEEHKAVIDFFDDQSWAHLECANRRFYW
jgi:flagellar biosynthesis/type III secretory pathway protein FliH